jgi:hypothetical protein
MVKRRKAGIPGLARTKYSTWPSYHACMVLNGIQVNYAIVSRTIRLLTHSLNLTCMHASLFLQDSKKMLKKLEGRRPTGGKKAMKE